MRTRRDRARGGEMYTLVGEAVTVARQLVSERRPQPVATVEEARA